MDPSHRCRGWTSYPVPHHHHHHVHHYDYHCHHHHHRPLIFFPHNHHLIICPHRHQHHHHHLNCHCHVSASFTPLQNSKPWQNEFNLEAEATSFKHASDYDSVTLQEQEYKGLVEEAEDEVEEPIFVLTDEWREFFAASEAKRKLEKKQAKKK